MKLLVTVLFSFVCLILIFQPNFASEANQPTNISVTVDSLTRNLITWNDETAVTGESYNIYVSEHQITAIHATGVVKVGRNIPEGAQQFLHTLYTPATNGAVNYYYAVSAVDQNGMENEIITAGGNGTELSVQNNALAVGCILLIAEEIIITTIKPFL